MAGSLYPEMEHLSQHCQMPKSTSSVTSSMKPLTSPSCPTPIRPLLLPVLPSDILCHSSHQPHASAAGSRTNDGDEKVGAGGKQAQNENASQAAKTHRKQCRRGQNRCLLGSNMEECWCEMILDHVKLDMHIKNL
jgi:hypothetical protein